MATLFPHLLEPLDLGFMTLPKQMVMGSMHVGLEETPGGWERMGEFYAAHVRGECGLMITGSIAPNVEGPAPIGR